MFGADESVETGSCCHYNQPGTNGSRPVDMFRILRVAYSKPIGQLLVSLPVVHPISYQTFSPQHVRVRELGVSVKERLEKMKETFDKVIAFLQTAGRFVSCMRVCVYVCMYVCMYGIGIFAHSNREIGLMSNTHRRRDETVLSRRRCEHNSQLAHATTADRFG